MYMYCLYTLASWQTPWMSHIQEPGKCYAWDPGPVQFHSNAECERIFSIVRKNKTEFRRSLSTKVLSSLVSHSSCVWLHMATHATRRFPVRIYWSRPRRRQLQSWLYPIDQWHLLPVNYVQYEWTCCYCMIAQVLLHSHFFLQHDEWLEYRKVSS